MALECWAYTSGSERGKLRWRRDGERPKVPNVLARRAVFSVCGRLTRHFPVCGWLRVAAAFVKWRANAVTTGWDDETQDPMLRRMLDEIVMRSSQTDPARGEWCADGQEVTLWVDASSLATWVAIEYDGAIIEDSKLAMTGARR